jgi:integrase
MTMTTKTRYPGIYKRESTRGVRYDVKYRDPTGKQCSVTKDTLDEARAFKRDMERSIERDEYVDTTDRVTVAQYAEQYVASRALNQRAATRARQSSAVRTHLVGTQLGAMPLRAVRREHVDTWLAERGQVVAHSTLRGLAGLLRSVFAYGVENRRLLSAPAVVLDRRRASLEDGRLLVPTVDDVRALADAMPDRERAMVVVQAATGLRVSELFALRVCDVSTTFRTLTVTAQLSRDGERVPTKTSSSTRTVPLSDAAAAAVDDHLRRYPTGDPDAYLFRSRSGRPYVMQSYGRTFSLAVKRAGLDPRLTSHTLRHHFATTLLRAGLSPVAVGHLLGHTNGALVVKTYAHWMPEDDDVARAALNAAWAPAAAAKSTLSVV